MSPFWDYTSLLLGTAFAVFWRYMDWKETQYGINVLGTKEENPFVRTKSGKMVKYAWLLLLIPVVLAWIAFFAFDETEHWDRFWCGVIAAIGGVASGIAYFSNKRLHEKIRERGGKVSPGTNVPGGGIV
jgi:peptidoglycan/LPS O-acetylase OafA/YrhL